MQWDVNFACIDCYIISNFSQTYHRPRTWLYPRKANEQLIPMIHCAYGNTVNFSRMSWIHFCQKYSIQTKWTEQPQNLPFFLGARGHTSNTRMPKLIPLATQNSIRIQTAILPQYTFWTDTHTDTQTTDGIGDRSIPIALMLCLYRVVQKSGTLLVFEFPTLLDAV